MESTGTSVSSRSSIFKSQIKWGRRDYRNLEEKITQRPPWRGSSNLSWDIANPREEAREINILSLPSSPLLICLCPTLAALNLKPEVKDAHWTIHRGKPPRAKAREETVHQEDQREVICHVEVCTEVLGKIKPDLLGPRKRLSWAGTVKLKPKEWAEVSQAEEIGQTDILNKATSHYKGTLLEQ